MLPCSQRLRMRAFSTGASRRGLVPISRIASASSIPAIAGVEEYRSRDATHSSVAPSWRQSRLARTERRHQVLERQHALDIAQIAGDGTDPSPAARAASRRWRRTLPTRSLRSACRPRAHGRSRRRRAGRRAKRVLSEIHSSFTSSFSRGRMRMTSARAYRRGCWRRAHRARRPTSVFAAPTAAPRRRRAWRSARRPGRDR